jgi:hypothetical protein
MTSKKGALTNKANHKTTANGTVKPITTQVFTEIKPGGGPALQNVPPNQLTTFKM